MKKNHYTIKDIARLSNVSRGTVDRVLHNRGKVSHKSRLKVEKVLSEIDYQPNLIARSLRQGQMYTLAVLLCKPDDPYWQMAFNGIQQAIAEFSSFGISVEVHHFSQNDSEDFNNCFHTILSKKPHGIAVAPISRASSDVFLELSLEKNIPVTVFNTPVQTKVNGFIGQDLYQSGRIGGDLLAKMNKSGGKFAIVHMDGVFRDSRTMQEKDMGFRSFFFQKDHYEVVSLNIDKQQNDIQDEWIKDFFAQHPDLAGLLVSTSKTYKIAAIMEELNIHANLIGYDLIPQNVHFLSKGIIDFLIHQNPHKQGYLAVKDLAEHFLFQKDIPAQNLLPIDIVNQENVNCYLENMQPEPHDLEKTDRI
ncbi:MAG: substrate-binding domain-containing protein [Bacteroidota bacterium]